MSRGRRDEDGSGGPPEGVQNRRQRVAERIRWRVLSLTIKTPEAFGLGG